MGEVKRLYHSHFGKKIYKELEINTEIFTFGYTDTQEIDGNSYKAVVCNRNVCDDNKIEFTIFIDYANRIILAVLEREDKGLAGYITEYYGDKGYTLNFSYEYKHLI